MMNETLARAEKAYKMGNYKEADTLVDGVYEAYTKGLYLSEESEELMFLLIRLISEKLYG